MQLWQLDVMGGLFLASGAECKVVTGADDHCRYCVLSAVVLPAIHVEHQDAGGQRRITIFERGVARLVAHEIDHWKAGCTPTGCGRESAHPRVPVPRAGSPWSYADHR